jgi:hypothetical protein
MGTLQEFRVHMIRANRQLNRKSDLDLGKFLTFSKLSL